jgi:hypothetical protein
MKQPVAVGGVPEPKISCSPEANAASVSAGRIAKIASANENWTFVPNDPFNTTARRTRPRSNRSDARTTAAVADKVKIEAGTEKTPKEAITATIKRGYVQPG